jgi:glutamate synthase domain-containing protein 2
VEFTDHVGTPLQEGLLLVHNTLVGLNLRSKIKLGASAKIVSAFEIARTMALGADWCNSARGFMFALGCIQSLSCHTDRCPTGVTTQDPSRNRALVVPHKIERVYNYHHATLHALAELLAAAGLAHPQQIRPIHFSQRTSTADVLTFAKLYPSLRPGELIDGTSDPRFREAWAMAQAGTFAAAS